MLHVHLLTAFLHMLSKMHRHCKYRAALATDAC